ncbi:MAG: hypothetical protein EBQ96_03540 [Proteobacteria bacterium]|nr:hypothetical protein [Pseudomonadota bacterium]
MAMYGIELELNIGSFLPIFKYPVAKNQSFVFWCIGFIEGVRVTDSLFDPAYSHLHPQVIEID